jgi:hypothetical protein
MPEQAQILVRICRFGAFQGGLQAFAAAVQKELPVLEKQQCAADDSDTVHVVSSSGFAAGSDGLWDDDHMAYFYTNLPNLSSVVPSMALNNGREAEEAEPPADINRQPTATSKEIQAVRSEAGEDADKASQAASAGAPSTLAFCPNLETFDS